MNRRVRALVALVAASLLTCLGLTAPAQAAMNLPSPSFSAPAEGFGSVAPFACNPTLRPGTFAFAQLLKSSSGYSYGTVRPCNATYGVANSQHKTGRAVDFSVNYRNTAQRADGQILLNWLFANNAERIRRLGVVEIIWAGKIWTTASDSGRITPSIASWRTYTGLGCPGSTDTNCHFDHFHFTLSAAGSEGTSSYWRAGMPAVPDSDGDGVNDVSDRCVSVPGLPGRRGCALPAATVTDFGADGRSDVFWPNPANGQWWVSSGASAAWSVANTAGVPGGQLKVGDLNGDRKADVFWANPSDGRWWVSYSGTSAWTIVNTANVPWQQLQLADINGDGKDDIFWANPGDGRWWVSYGATSAWSVLNTANVPFEQLLLGDLDGDRKADVFWANPSDGRWWVSYGATSAWSVINSASVPFEELMLGDLDGDGKDDVFWANPGDGRWWVSSGGTNAWSVVNTANVPFENLRLADVDGDGKEDVFWPNPGDGRWWVSSGGTSAWSVVNSASVPSYQVVVG